MSGDLSMVDIYGRRWSGGRRTANCYVVSRPGDYRIPLIYGSAVKNGVTNAAAYTNGGGTYQAAFVNYKGRQITAPNIETDTLTSAASAELSLADENNIFTNVSLATIGGEKFLCFKVASVPAVGANGILAIKDNNGNIMWSWHIWVWGDSLATVRLTNHTGYNYDILPVNLASKWDDSSKAHIKNWYYQWGRKDPMCPPASYNASAFHTLYGVRTWGNEMGKEVNFSIQKPFNYFTLYENTYNKWNTLNTFCNFWDANANSMGAYDNLASVVKTVYDPCPAGFTLPVGNTFTGFTTTGDNSTNVAEFNIIGGHENGWKFKANAADVVGHHFNASGGIAYWNVSILFTGVNSNYWTSATTDAVYQRQLRTNISGVYVKDDAYAVYGQSVRPIREYDYMGI